MMSCFSEGTWLAEDNKIKADGKLIAVLEDLGEDYESITEANSRLIVEAPRMYRMLKKCAELVDEDFTKRIKLLFDYIDGRNGDYYTFGYFWEDE